jgi:hypothetical protein
MLETLDSNSGYHCLTSSLGGGGGVQVEAWGISLHTGGYKEMSSIFADQ